MEIIKIIKKIRVNRRMTKAKKPQVIPEEKKGLYIYITYPKK